MKRCLVALTLVLAAGTGLAQAQGPDPLESPACRRALDALDTQEAVVGASVKQAPRGEASKERAVAMLLELRRRAARACLGGNADSLAPPTRLAQPPISVSPATVAPSGLSRPPPVAPVPPPVQIERPRFVTSCDAGGCWVNDGTRLPRAGASLIGPHGLCSVQGALLVCP